LHGLFAQIETAWPAIRDFLLGSGPVIGIATDSVFVLTLILRWVTGGITRSKVARKWSAGSLTRAESPLSGLESPFSTL
jgi:hypothetical protein